MSEYSTEQRISALQRYYDSACVDIRYIPKTPTSKGHWLITAGDAQGRGNTLTRAIDSMEDGCIEHATNQINIQIELATGHAIALTDEQYLIEHTPSYNPDEAARVAEEIGEQNAYLDLLHRTRARYMQSRK